VPQVAERARQSAREELLEEQDAVNKTVERMRQEVADLRAEKMAQEVAANEWERKFKKLKITAKARLAKLEKDARSGGFHSLSIVHVTQITRLTASLSITSRGGWRGHFILFNSRHPSFTLIHVVPLAQFTPHSPRCRRWRGRQRRIHRRCRCRTARWAGVELARGRRQPQVTR